MWIRILGEEIIGL